MKGPSRLLLILLLLPVLLLGAWLAVQDVWLPVHDWNVSPDGSRLVALVNHDLMDDARGGRTILWDLTSRQRIASRQDDDTQCVFFSPDGQTIVTGHDDGTISVRDAGTLVERTRVSIGDPYGYPLAFVRDEATLLVYTAGPQPQTQFNPQLRLVRIDQSRVVGHPIPARSARVSTDRQTFLVRRHSESRPDRFALFRFCDGEPSNIREFELDDEVWWYSMSSDGRYAAMAIYKTRVVQLWDLSTGKLECEIAEPGIYATAFVDDGRLLATSHRSGSVRLWKVPSGKPAGQWQSQFPFLSYIPHTSFHDWNVELFRFAPITLRDLKTGEVLATLPMRGGIYYAIAAVECLVLAAWSTAWVLSGRASRTPRPLLDAAVVHGVVALILAARFVSLDIPHILRVPTGGLLLAELVAASCLAAMWAAVADHRWMVRASAGLAALAGATAALVSVPYYPGVGHLFWDSVVAAVSLVVCVTCGGLVSRRFGLRVAREGPSARHHEGVRGSQILLRDLFIFTTAIAAFVAVNRSFWAFHLDSRRALFLICEGAMLALVSAAAAWVALARVRRPFRALVFPLACIGSVSHSAFFLKDWIEAPPWWYLAAHSAVAMIIATTLLVFRLHGYRIRRSLPSTK